MTTAKLTLADNVPMVY